MKNNYSEELKVTTDDLASIGLFVVMWGYLEYAINLLIINNDLGEQLKNLMKKKNLKIPDNYHKAFEDKNLNMVNDSVFKKIKFDERRKVLLYYFKTCKSSSTQSTTHSNGQVDEVISVLVEDLKEKSNNIVDCRNKIVHDSLLVSVMGCWQPGPGYGHKNYTNFGKNQVKVFSTFTFDDIKGFAYEIEKILKILRFRPKHKIDIENKCIHLL